MGSYLAQPGPKKRRRQCQSLSAVLTQTLSDQFLIGLNNPLTDTNMNARVIPWTIEIADIDTQLRVGIWEHELAPQPIRVNLTVRAIACALPQSIEACVNYEPICRWIIDDWPQEPHTQLLETRLRELMSFVFAIDDRIEWIDAAISKPQAIRGVRGVGLRMALSRDDFEAAFRYPATSAAQDHLYLPAADRLSIGR
jgi:7,8-dihydroneopterin aldolase/epimerase/oxygenase